MPYTIVYFNGMITYQGYLLDFDLVAGSGMYMAEAVDHTTGARYGNVNYITP